MNMQYQDLVATKAKVTKMYTKNPNRSLSGTFHKIRTQQRISFIGDYPLISTIVTTVINLGVTPTRFQVRHALNKSKELRSYPKNIKSELLDQLVNTTHVQIKLAKNPLEVKKIIKMNKTLSK